MSATIGELLDAFKQVMVDTPDAMIYLAHQDGDHLLTNFELRIHARSLDMYSKHGKETYTVSLAARVLGQYVGRGFRDATVDIFLTDHGATPVTEIQIIDDGVLLSTDIV